jgi:hypothetical protein
MMPSWEVKNEEGIDVRECGKGKKAIIAKVKTRPL